MALPQTFVKMHGLGNDFVIFDGRSQGLSLTPDFCRQIADRRTGVGCDQIIVLEPPQNSAADLFMRIFNADGSSSGACGNATRCVARLLFENGKTTATIETVAGLLPVWLQPDGLIAVDFGPPLLEWQQIPLTQKSDTLHVPLTLPPLSDPCAVSMGNPHIVFFVADIQGIALETLGPQIEHHPLFPERTNVHIAQILAPDRIRMRVWERGAGITSACGSGACAVQVAAVRRGLTARRATLELDGGALIVEWREKDQHVILIGPTAHAFSGTL